MTTINDRITRLEDAFISQQELNREIVGLLKSIADTQRQHTTILQEHTGLLKEHTMLLQGVVSTLQEHSIDLKFIKEHLG